jgi:TonB-dependent starch-binding outer membrane protein SusC
MIAMLKKLRLPAYQSCIILLTCFFLTLYSSVNAQEEKVTYTGTVKGPDGKAVEKASVTTKDQRYGTTTNDEGKFTLVASKSPNRILVISSVGYKSVEIRTGNNTDFNIQMTERGDDLDEVVVIGYGSRKRNEVSGAVTKVGANMLTKQPITSFEQGLAGLTPGVTLREGTGAPGAAPEIIVRGINGFSGNSPLYVIDDVIFEDANTGNQTNTPFALLNPEDIESVTILKDAITKSIYGSRANNGVVIITTKKGKEGPAKITFNSSIGTQNVMGFEEPDVMNANQLARFLKEKEVDRIRATNPAYADPKVEVPDNLLPTNRQYDPNIYNAGTNWFDVVTRSATIQNHNISVRGGTQNVKYFFSGNFLNQEGVVINNDLKRFSFRANLDIKITPKLKYGLTLNPSRTEQNRPADDPGGGQFSAYGTITSTYWADPTAPVYQPNGLLTYTTQSQTQFASNWTANPLYQLTAEVEKRKGSQILVGSYLEYEPIKNLIFRSNFSYGFTNNRTRNFQPSTLVGDGSLTPQFPNIDGGRASLFQNTTDNVTSDNTVRYRFIKNKHNVEGMAGLTFQDIKIETSSINAKRIIDENFQLPSFGNVDPAVAGAFSGSEGFRQSRILSFISRLNYAYDNKYLLNVTFRRDGSSRFGRDVQYGNFPAFSLGWRLTEEKFMDKLRGSFLDELRIEAGYGLTGNSRGPGEYGHLGTIGGANYIFGGANALGNSLTVLPNPRITWEETKQFDASINASLFKRRVQLSFSIYDQRTSQSLAAIPISWISGFGNVTGNLDNETQNKGFEFQVEGLAIRKKNFTYSAMVNISKYKNKLTKYNIPNVTIANAGNGTGVAVFKEGLPVGMYRGFRILGLFTAAEIADPSVPKYAGAREGSLKWADINGNGVLDFGEGDYDILDSPHPDLMFGMSHTIGYKGFTLRAVFAGQFGGAIYDLRREIMWNVDGNFNVSKLMLDRWRPGDDPATKKFPTTVSLTGNTTRAVRFPSDNKIYDGTYIALKNVTLTYNLTKALNKRKKLFDAVEVYASMRNVFYIASYKYGNPEIRRANEGSGARSINYGSYPISRALTLGVNLTF